MASCISGISLPRVNTEAVDHHAAPTAPVTQAPAPMPPPEAHLPPRPDAPRSSPRASLMTQRQFGESAQARDTAPKPFEKVSPEVMLKMASHLPASDRTSLSNVAWAFKQQLPTAGREHKAISQALSALTPNGMEGLAALGHAVDVLVNARNYEDRTAMMRALVPHAQQMLEAASINTRTPALSDMFKVCATLLSAIDSPQQILPLAGSMALKAGLAHLHRSDFPVETLNTLWSALRGALPKLTAEERVGESADEVALLLRNMNSSGISHLAPSERGPALSEHLTAMEALHAQGYAPPSRVFDPVRTAQRQLETLPPDQQAELRPRLDALESWRR